MPFDSERGASVIELMMALTGAMLLFGSLLAMAKTSLDIVKASEFGQEIHWVVDRGSALKRSSGNYAQMNNNFLISNTDLPQGMMAGGNVIWHTYQDTITVAPAGIDRFGVTIRVPREHCVDALISAWDRVASRSEFMTVSGLLAADNTGTNHMNNIVAGCSVLNPVLYLEVEW